MRSFHPAGTIFDCKPSALTSIIPLSSTSSRHYSHNRGWIWRVLHSKRSCNPCNRCGFSNDPPKVSTKTQMRNLYSLVGNNGIELVRSDGRDGVPPGSVKLDAEIPWLFGISAALPVDVLTDDHLGSTRSVWILKLTRVRRELCIPRRAAAFRLPLHSRQSAQRSLTASQTWAQCRLLQQWQQLRRKQRRRGRHALLRLVVGCLEAKKVLWLVATARQVQRQRNYAVDFIQSHARLLHWLCPGHVGPRRPAALPAPTSTTVHTSFTARTLVRTLGHASKITFFSSKRVWRRTCLIGVCRVTILRL